MLHQGKLKGWDPVKGSGFIQQDKAGPDIRIGSEGFRKTPERLQNGDSIFFQIEVDPQGTAKAVLAYKAGQRFAPAPIIKQPSLSSLRFQQLLSLLVMFTILAWLAYQSAYLFKAEAALPAQSSHELTASEESNDAVFLESPVWPPVRLDQKSNFQCEGKQHCSEMSSCDEARFYLENCPNVLIDGDKDGIPCEQQHCGHSRF